ncbi:MAG: winged helix-turn-helix domain-containing protein [Gammaproteobacteria bacterium]|nr:winged helix-turn-helix domain-containing protein [Gammaproteobacteria bacterium]MCW9005017.1 winged helix-turn-helix domain-containing protein [Gammaproteobacteria bacterium]
MTEQLNIPPGSAFQLAEWHIDPQSGRINTHDSEAKLEPKVMAVLVCLAQNAGQVISREQLEAEVWSDMVVGYDSLASTIIKLRKAFGDDSKNPHIIETVPKKGYRLIAEVRLIDDHQQAPLAEHPVNRRISDVEVHRSQLPYLFFGSVVLVALSIILWMNKGSDTLNIDAISQQVIQRPSLAVLPFKNFSNDPEQDYFSDGMTADLITDLSKLSGLSVIARNSVFAYKNSDIDVRKVGEELGVHYIVEGSVQKVADTVRISARLIDSRTGFNVWAERFDGELKNVFKLQDEVTNKIVAALEIKLTERERLQLAREYTDSIEAYDHFLHGWQLFWNLSRDSNLIAREYYLKAIELDGNFARAYSNLALTYAYEYINGWSEAPGLAIENAKHYAEKALSLDDSLPQIHWVMGLIETFGKNYQHAMQEARRSIELDPNFADGYGLLATVLNYAGQTRDALEVMDKAMQLNPRHSFIYKVIRGEIHFNLHEYDKAIEYFNLALERNPVAEEPRLWLAAAYAHQNRLGDARWELEQINNTDDELSIDYFDQVIPLKDPVQRKHLIDGLYKAGLNM